MRVVWKYPFSDGIWKPLIIEVPTDHRLVHVEYQEGIPTAWVELDPDKPKHQRIVLTVYGTGQPIVDPFITHVGTLMRNGFVWHVYMKEIPD